MRLVLALVLLVPSSVLAAAPRVARPTDGELRKQLAPYVSELSKGALTPVSVEGGFGQRVIANFNLFSAGTEGYRMEYVAVLRFQADAIMLRADGKTDWNLRPASEEDARREPERFERFSKGDELAVLGSAGLGGGVSFSVARAVRNHGKVAHVLALASKAVGMAERQARDVEANGPACPAIGAALAKHAAEDAAIAKELRTARENVLEDLDVKRVFGERTLRIEAALQPLEACQEDPSVRGYAKRLGS